MDRNAGVSTHRQAVSWSLSARRAWIEIMEVIKPLFGSAVALRKESVDRNIAQNQKYKKALGRSPQGERG